MQNKTVTLFVILAGISLIILAVAVPAQAKPLVLTPIEQLGKMLFFDQALSFNENQSCAACHDPAFGYTGSNEAINLHGAVYEGSIPGAFGNRKPPTSAYAGDSPLLHFNDVDGVWVGGMFWDGRATGWTLGDPLAEQAKGPFLNPMEQAILSAEDLCWKVYHSSYTGLFVTVWGSLECDDPTEVSTVYDQIGYSIAAYERSVEVNPFSSRFDRFWAKAKIRGKDVTQINMTNWQEYRGLGLSRKQVFGLAVFNDKGKCALCHTLDEGSAGYPLFTDFTYDNLGIPKNPENPFYADHPDFVDLGLGEFLEAAGFPPEVFEGEMGKFKVPTLRNVDQRLGKSVKAYGHNGFFKSLKELVHFYNTRDVEPWPAPEYGQTVNDTELGDLGLTEAEEDALVIFMQTLTDKHKNR